MPTNHSQTPTPYHPGRRAYHPALDSPQAKARAMSPSVAIDFGVPPSPYNMLPPGTVVPSPIVSPTAVYPSPIAPPPLASARGGYHSQTSSPTAYHPRSAIRRNTDGTYFETQPPSQSRVEARKKNVVVVADEPREHGPRSRDPIPGTPHWKAGTLSRGEDGSGVDPADRRGLRLDTSDALLRPTHPLENSSYHKTRRIDSPLYKPEPHPIRYEIPFISVIPGNSPNGDAALVEVPGLMEGMSPTKALQGRDDVLFSNMYATITYVFEATGYERVTREVNLMDTYSLRRSTVAGGVCTLVRDFYREHRELGIDPEKVVPLGLIKKNHDREVYVVVAGVVV
ncbi:hypothetical protein PENSPDRAFT_287063 [Peniophora sp. CONT]|nr:hypothetical protein PENSPDRAFT_287063 [Peniophora sp. CONT]